MRNYPGIHMEEPRKATNIFDINSFMFRPRFKASKNQNVLALEFSR
jgi:hypothetical protein